MILYLGLCNGAGWAATLRNCDIVLLGLKKIIEHGGNNESSSQRLICHEAGHVWHRTYGVLHFQAPTQAKKSLLQLYQEGIAMVCEQMQLKGEHHCHQNKNGRIAWRLQNEPDIRGEYLRRLCSG